jgi:chromosome segregation ATPase
MADDLLSQYIDRKSIKDDTVFMVEEFDKIYKEFQKINSLKVTLDLSSSFGKAAGVVNEMKKSDDALAASIQNVNKEFVQLAPVIKNADAAIQQINSGLDEGARALAELKLRAAENAKAQKDLVKAYQDGKVSLEDYTRQAGALIQRDQDLKVQIADLTSQQKQFAKENNAVAGSMDQAGIRLGRLREEYRSLTDEEKASPFGKNLESNLSMHSIPQ